MHTQAVRHRRIQAGGHDLFLREAGPAGAPVLLLPHGYPCSSFQFRRLMPALADRWRTVAFDWPGFGYSDTPDPAGFGYDFDAYEGVLTAVADALGLERYALWLHDYGSQIGLRHAIAHPDRITALIIQNGDIYADVLGPSTRSSRIIGPIRHPRRIGHWSRRSARTASGMSSSVKWTMTWPRGCRRICGNCIGR